MNTAMEGVCASSNKVDARDYSLLYIYNPQQVAMLLAILCHIVLNGCLFIQILVLFAMPLQSSLSKSFQASPLFAPCFRLVRSTLSCSFGRQFILQDLFQPTLTGNCHNIPPFSMLLCSLGNFHDLFHLDMALEQ